MNHPMPDQLKELVRQARLDPDAALAVRVEWGPYEGASMYVKLDAVEVELDIEVGH